MLKRHRREPSKAPHLAALPSFGEFSVREAGPVPARQRESVRVELESENAGDPGQGRVPFLHAVNESTLLRGGAALGPPSPD